MFNIKQKPAFVFKLKEKEPAKETYKESSPEFKLQLKKTTHLTIDMFKYLVSFIHDMDTLISYVLAVPYTIYEVKNKFLIMKSNMHISIEMPVCLYKYMNESLMTIKILNVFFSFHMLLTYLANNKYIYNHPNAKEFTIYLIHEQNKMSLKQIYKLIKKKENKNYYLNMELDLNRTIHPYFNVLDTLTNEELANLSENVEIYEIDNYILKELQNEYILSNIKILNRKDRALLMFYYEKFIDKQFLNVYKRAKIEKLLIAAIKSNNFKIINIVLKNYSLTNFYRDFNICSEFICNLNTERAEFKIYKNIITYFLEKLIDKHAYDNVICNMINFAYEHNNNGIVKYLLSLKNAKNGISLLYKYRYVGCSNNLVNNKLNEEITEYHKEFSIKQQENNLFVMYDFIIKNLKDDKGNLTGININLVTIDILYLLKYHTDIDRSYYAQYIYIIDSFINNFDSPNCNNIDDKYYCDRQTLINMYYILIKSYFTNSKYITLLEYELNKSLLKPESEQLSNDNLRESIKKIYHMIRKHKKQAKIVSEYLEKLDSLTRGTIVYIRELDSLFDYIITVPEFFRGHTHFKNVVKRKIIEFLNSEVLNDEYIEHVQLKITMKKLHTIIDEFNDDDDIEDVD